MSDQEITQFRIYPSIGIARVGNSPDEYFFGPEAPGPHPHDPDNFRDSQGRIKRQAARFRVYGFNSAGEVVKEMTDDDAQIRWTVQVANTKSAWFDFDLAMDIPAAANIASTRRNLEIEDRNILEIKPDEIQIHGRNTNADGRDADYAFEDGCYGPQQDNVYLGELRTDDAGRLIFLGGRGHSANPWGHPATTFANNKEFHDDVSDGWVDARIRYQGHDHPVLGAWVVTGPPNFAPGIQGIVTGYDLLYDLFCETHVELRIETPRFTKEIWPLLRRLPNHQWVNAGFARDFGLGSPNDWSNSNTVRQLANDSVQSLAIRNAVFNLFRNADYSYPLSNAVPGYYGDAMTTDTSSTDPMGWMAVTKTQYRWLEQWAAGEFIDDYHATPISNPADEEGLAILAQSDGPATPFEELTPAEQVRGIDRAVLDETLGGPFHPGAEFTWPMRQGIMYSEPFRIKRRQAEPDHGPQLTQSSALAPGGPLDGSVPGSISRWMAVPWQTDTSSCLSGYLPFIDDYLPTFWPARVPNDVLTEAQFKALTEGSGPSQAAFTDALSYLQRPKWLRGIRYPKGIAFPQQVNSKLIGVNRFIKKWFEVGIVTQVWADSETPGIIWYETGRTLDHDETEDSTPIQEENPRVLFGQD